MTQVIIATAFGLGVTAALLALCIGHRSGRIPLLRWADWTSTRVFGVPGWAGLPSLIALVTLLPALFGLQWDESLHIADGRDDGPLANPSHYLLLGGIFGSLAAGLIACAMGDERVPRSGIRYAGWCLPLGGVLATAGTSVALLGFPADDVWHRIFGQDVTLWSPTHIAMIAGLSLAVIGFLVLNVEGMRARAAGERGRGGERGPGAARTARGAEPPPLYSVIGRRAERFSGTIQRVVLLVQRMMIPAALLLVLSLLQGEFDYGVPQFRLVFHPMVIMVAAGIGLVAARVFLGPGAALGGAVVFLAIRGAIALIVGPGLGQPDHIFPLYLAEAVIVELVALRVDPRRALRFGVACGVLIGTLGLAAEWAWSSAFPIPWPAELLPEALILGLGMALAGAVLGAWIGGHLRAFDPVRTPALRAGAVISAVAIAAMIGYGLIEPAPDPVRATVTLTDVDPAPQRTVQATVRLDPADAAAGSDWFRSIAWQGGDLLGEQLEEVAPGVWRTTEPLPAHGNWKSAIRLAHGGSLTGLTIFAPADDAIPVGEIPAPAGTFTREFGDEAEFLRREAADVAGWLWVAATGLVALVFLALLGAWAAALHRLAITAPRERPGGRGPARRSSPREAELVG